MQTSKNVTKPLVINYSTLDTPCRFTRDCMQPTTTELQEHLINANSHLYENALKNIQLREGNRHVKIYSAIGLFIPDTQNEIPGRISAAENLDESARHDFINAYRLFPPNDKDPTQPRFIKFTDYKETVDWGASTRGLVGFVFPLINGAEGVIMMGKSTPLTNEDESDFHSIMGVLMANVLNTFAHLKEFRDVYSEAYIESFIINSLLFALELHDEVNNPHNFVVAELARRLGVRLGLSQEELYDLRIGALLHDVGKFGIPVEILRKNGALTEEEWQFMKNHSIIGYNILRILGFNERICLTALQHHENEDGTGYPYNLLGKYLIKLSKIIRVADSISAHCQERKHHPARSLYSAVNYIHDRIGTEFNEEIALEAIDMLLEDPEMVELLQHNLGYQ